MHVYEAFSDAQFSMVIIHCFDFFGTWHSQPPSQSMSLFPLYKLALNTPSNQLCAALLFLTARCINHPQNGDSDVLLYPPAPQNLSHRSSQMLSPSWWVGRGEKLILTAHTDSVRASESELITLQLSRYWTPRLLTEKGHWT